MKALRKDVDRESDARSKAKLDTILEHAPEELKLAVQAASEKGASSWVTSTPSYDYYTILHKGKFVDACCTLWMDTFKPPSHMRMWNSI